MDTQPITKKLRGYIYYIFPCEYDTGTDEITMIKHWVNTYFQWILIYLVSPFLDFLEYLTYQEYNFYVYFSDENIQQLKK